MKHRNKDREERELMEASKLTRMGGCLGSMDEAGLLYSGCRSLEAPVTLKPKQGSCQA